ncbi:MAG: hypothetical protein JO148_12255 [Acidimicrobiia bacterium]|nr:hypothetical protein [Acidimicrobiia bacterium]
MRRAAVTRVALLLIVVGTLTAACSGNGTTTDALVGTFRLDAGQCRGPGQVPAGSWLAVLNAAANQSVANPDGGCNNPAYTPLSAGHDGGLRAGSFQPSPDPTFGPTRDSLAGAIVTPVRFQGLALGMATDGHDEQHDPTGPAVFPAPTATVSGGHLHIDLRSLEISYGGPPGGTCATAAVSGGCWDLGSRSVTGSYDARTHRFVAQWFVGEAFTPAGDSMTVHLEGTFVPGRP